MSTNWILANRWFTGYDNVKRGDLDRTTVTNCAFVMSRLCERANPSGVVAIYIEDLMRTTKLSRSSVFRAMAQLQRDGHIWQAIRGQGNRTGEFKGLAKSPSVYVLRPMAQQDGSIRPVEPELQEAWMKYARSDAFQNRPMDQRDSIREAMENAWTLGSVPPEKERQAVQSRPADTYQKGTKRRSHLQPVPSIEEPKQDDPACG